MFNYHTGHSGDLIFIYELELVSLIVQGILIFAFPGFPGGLVMGVCDMSADQG